MTGSAARTEVCVELVGGRPRLRLRSGLLRALRVHGPDDLVRIALVASTALLLGGDGVELAVRIGTGVRLEVFEVAATVAYHGRGRPAAWQVAAELADGAELIMAGQPFVVADGAEVDRWTRLELAGTARLTMRETLVLGRSGEIGGRLRNRTTIRRDGVELLREDQLLEPGSRTLPGLLGPHRVIDTLSSLGPDRPATPVAPGVAQFRVLDDAGLVHRWIGDQLADSPLRTPGVAAPGEPQPSTW